MCINYSPSPVRLRRHDLFVEQLDGAKGVPLPSNCTQREKTPLSDYKKHTNYKIKTKKSVKTGHRCNQSSVEGIWGVKQIKALQQFNLVGKCCGNTCCEVQSRMKLLYLPYNTIPWFHYIITFCPCKHYFEVYSLKSILHFTSMLAFSTFSLQCRIQLNNTNSKHVNKSGDHMSELLFAIPTLKKETSRISSTRFQPGL